MKAFSGFPSGKTRVVRLPEQAFTELIPIIDDLAELKVTLHVLWRLEQEHGRVRYLREVDLVDDHLLLVGLGENGLDRLSAALERAVDTPWVDVVLARINYAGKNMDASPQKITPILEELDRAGTGVYGMKVVGCGDLAKNVRRALRFALDLPSVHAISVGMLSRQQVDQNIGWVEEHDRALQPG